MRNLAQDAVMLAERGWRVVPLHTARGAVCDCNRPACPSVAKHPRVMDWVNVATTDIAQIAVWWEMYPAANIGVVTGPESGIVVIDIDPRHGGDEELLRLFREHGTFPAGPTAATGGGGEHYYFAHPGGRVLSRTIAPGIDVKGDGGQVVAPPSVHATGISYEWYDELGPELPSPALPDWLLLLMQQGGPKHDEGTRVIPKDVAPGNRNNELASFGGSMRKRGAPERVIFAALLAWNDEWVEPLPRTEVAQIAASVSRYEPTEATLVVDLAPKVVSHKRATGPVRDPITMRAIQQMELPPIRWAIPEMLPEGLCVCAGRVKLGKSWLMLELCRAVAEGDTACSYVPCDSGDTLYLALEDDFRRLQGRGQTMLGDGGEWPERMHLVPMDLKWPRLNMGGHDAIDAWLGQYPEARLVVIDTWAKFAPVPDPQAKRGNAYMEDYNLMEGLQQMALRHHVALVVVTHFNKAMHDDWVNQISGSTGLTGAADTLMALSRPRGKKGQAEAQLRATGRDLAELDLSMSFDDKTGRWSVLGETEQAAQSQGTAELVEILGRIGQPVTKVEIAAMTGRTQAASYMALYRASVEGSIVNYGRGLFGLKANPLLDLSGLHADQGGKDVVVVGAPDNITPITALTGLTQNGVTPAKSYVPGGKPTGPCPTCSVSDAWTLRVGGRWMCDICQPVVKPVPAPEGT